MSHHIIPAMEATAYRPSCAKSKRALTHAALRERGHQLRRQVLVTQKELMVELQAARRLLDHEGLGHAAAATDRHQAMLMIDAHANGVADVGHQRAIHLRKD